MTRNVRVVTLPLPESRILPALLHRSFRDYHFKPHDGNHAELDGQEKLNAVEDLLMSFSNFE